jgi:hypothetical protein
MRNDCLDMASDVFRASVRSATNALSEFATQCLPLHQPVGVIGPQGIYWRTPPPELYKHIASPQNGQSALSRRRRLEESRCDAVQIRCPKRPETLTDIPPFGGAAVGYGQALQIDAPRSRPSPWACSNTRRSLKALLGGKPPTRGPTANHRRGLGSIFPASTMAIPHRMIGGMEPQRQAFTRQRREGSRRRSVGPSNSIWFERARGRYAT